MAADYGHFAMGASAGSRHCQLVMCPRSKQRSYFGKNQCNNQFNSQLTPSFFCRLDDEVVYWNTSRLSG